MILKSSQNLNTRKKRIYFELIKVRHLAGYSRTEIRDEVMYLYDIPILTFYKNYAKVITDIK